MIRTCSSERQNKMESAGRRLSGILPRKEADCITGGLLLSSERRILIKRGSEESVVCMTHEESGICKRVSEPVYPADILSDPAIISCHGMTRGCWYHCLFLMWRDARYEITNTMDGFARIWGITREDCEKVMAEMDSNKPCDIVTDANGNITLKSRRLERRYKRLQSNAQRQRRKREKDASNGDVPEQKGASSSSLSSSSSMEKNRDTWLTPYNEVWNRHFGVDMPFAKSAKALKEIEKHYKPEQICRGLDVYLRKTQIQFANVQKFAETAGAWIAQSVNKGSSI